MSFLLPTLTLLPNKHVTTGSTQLLMICPLLSVTHSLLYHTIFLCSISHFSFPHTFPPPTFSLCPAVYCKFLHLCISIAKYSASFHSSSVLLSFPHPLIIVCSSFLIPSSCCYMIAILPKLFTHLVPFVSSISCLLPDSTRVPLLLDLRSSLRPSDHERDLGRRRKRRPRRRETWPKHALDTATSSAGLMAGAAICAHLCPWHSLVLAAYGSVALRWVLPVCPGHPPSQG